MGICLFQLLPCHFALDLQWAAKLWCILIWLVKLFTNNGYAICDGQRRRVSAFGIVCFYCVYLLHVWAVVQPCTPPPFGVSNGGWGVCGGVVGCLPVWIYCIHLYYTLSTGVNPGLCLSEGMRMWGNGFQAWGIKCPETFLFRKLHAGFSPHFLCSAPTWQFFHHECLFFFPLCITPHKLFITCFVLIDFPILPQINPCYIEMSYRSPRLQFRVLHLICAECLRPPFLTHPQ